MKKSSLLVSCAVAGLILGGQNAFASEHQKKVTDEQDKNGCQGKNSCKGKDGKDGKNSCKGKDGKNSCKGKKKTDGANACSGPNGCDGKEE